MLTMFQGRSERARPVRFAFITVVLFLAAFGLVTQQAPAEPMAAPDDNCRAAVATAFDKQRASKGYRFEAKMAGPIGETKMTIDYMPPDRMYQKVEAPGQAPVETIAIARWAWGTMGGGWEELQPQFAQSIIAHVRSTLVNPPEITAAFTCLGEVKFEGRDVLGYRADQTAKETDASAGGHLLSRTVYVDLQSGLPVANIVAEEGGSGSPVFNGRYSYPTDIVIEPPIGGHAVTPKN